MADEDEAKTINGIFNRARKPLTQTTAETSPISEAWQDIKEWFDLIRTYLFEPDKYSLKKAVYGFDGMPWEKKPPSEADLYPQRWDLLRELEENPDHRYKNMPREEALKLILEEFPVDGASPQPAATPATAPATPAQRPPAP